MSEIFLLILTNFVVPTLAFACVVLTFVFGVRAIAARFQAKKAKYGFEHQELLYRHQADIAKSVAFLILSFVILGIVAFTYDNGTPSLTVEGEPTAVSSLIPPTTDASLSIQVSPTIGFIPTIDVTPTPFVAVPPTTEETPATQVAPTAIAPTIEPTVFVAPTVAVEIQQTAVVSSGVGVWLRSAPTTQSTQVEWLLDGAVVVVLPDLQNADGYEWQAVRANSGQEGWVAVPFILYR